MDLKDFIKVALVDISNATREANEELDGTGAIANPRNLFLESRGSEIIATAAEQNFEPGEIVEMVHFDVAVTA